MQKLGAFLYLSVFIQDKYTCKYSNKKIMYWSCCPYALPIDDQKMTGVLGVTKELRLACQCLS